jgi:hypothetical protein
MTNAGYEPLFSYRSRDSSPLAKVLVERIKLNIRDPFVQHIHPEQYKEWASPSEVLVAMAIALEEVNSEPGSHNYGVDRVTTTIVI